MEAKAVNIIEMLERVMEIENSLETVEGNGQVATFVRSKLSFHLKKYQSRLARRFISTDFTRQGFERDRMSVHCEMKQKVDNQNNQTTESDECNDTNEWALRRGGFGDKLFRQYRNKAIAFWEAHGEGAEDVLSAIDKMEARHRRKHGKPDKMGVLVKLTFLHTVYRFLRDFIYFKPLEFDPACWWACRESTSNIRGTADAKRARIRKQNGRGDRNRRMSGKGEASTGRDYTGMTAGDQSIPPGLFLIGLSNSDTADTAETNHSGKKGSCAEDECGWSRYKGGFLGGWGFRDKMDGWKEAVESAVFCVPCHREISRSTLPYHIRGQRHLQRKNTFSGGEEIVDLMKEGVFCRDLPYELYEKSSLLYDMIKQRTSANNGGTAVEQERRIIGGENYFCDICNSDFNKATAYQNHFIMKKHARELKRLGITYAKFCIGIYSEASLQRIRRRIE